MSLMGLKLHAGDKVKCISMNGMYPINLNISEIYTIGSDIYEDMVAIVNFTCTKGKKYTSGIVFSKKDFIVVESKHKNEAVIKLANLMREVAQAHPEDFKIALEHFK